MPSSWTPVRPLATDDEQVHFWRRHVLTGVVLCVVLPLVVVLDALLWSPASAQHTWLLVAGAACVAALSPLLLLVPVERVVRHRRGRFFFDAWEAAGVALVTTFALLDGGAGSPYVLFYYVLIAHAALAYPPLGMLIAGTGNVAGYLVVVAVAGGVPAGTATVNVLTLAVATATSAFASHNHVRTYRRTAALAAELATLAERDGLTGLLNHRVLHDRLDRAAAGADAGNPLTLVVVDVDRFKSVNDTHGHPCGDEVLRTVGEVLRTVAREEDTAARVGGDEFALLMPGLSLPQATAVAARVRDEVRVRAAAYGATVSIGLARASAPSTGAALAVEADRAVYRAKRAGRDRVDAAREPGAVPEQARAPQREAATSPTGAPSPTSSSARSAPRTAGE